MKHRGYDGFGGVVSEFASDSTPWWPAERRAADGAPNVVVMLVDDLGFSDLGPFGSEIETPAVDELAAEGWVFTNYRTAPLCSPARAALLTGLNPHRAGFGFVAHADPGFPGFTCELPSDAPTLAESLRAGGYATFAVGKWHLTLESRLHDAADKSSWPLQRGFDRYFGSMDGFTTLYHPHRLVRDNSVVDIPEFPDDFFLTDALTDEATRMIDELRANDATKPFFLYFAHTAVHGPVQAKATDIDRQSGRYAEGWNRLREERFERQKALGIVPAHAVLPSDDLAGGPIPEWESLSEEEQKLFARHMEVYAAAVQEIDESVARLRQHLADLGELENTIIVVASDNGGTAEGGPGGTRSYFAQFGHAADLPEDWVRDVPRDPALIGGPRVHGHYPAGWARVSNTPFRSFKQHTYEGGVHAPLIVSWPAHPETVRGLRAESVFVTDITPTILDLTGVPRLPVLNGAPTIDVDGESMAELFENRVERGRAAQYWECVGRRAMLDGPWKALSDRAPTKLDGAGGGVWELYNLADDPTETMNLAGSEPEKVEELAQRWVEEAWRNTVFPLDDDQSLTVTRPVTEARLAEPVTLAPFRPPLERFRASKLTALRSFEVDISLRTDEGCAGVVVAHGDQGGGYLLAIDEGRTLLSYNAYGEMHRARSEEMLAPGTHDWTLRVDEEPGLRCRVALVAEGRELCAIDDLPMLIGMAPFTGISVGYDYGGPVDWDLHEQHRSYRFTAGTIVRVRYRPGAASEHDPTVLRAIGEAVADFAD